MYASYQDRMNNAQGSTDVRINSRLYSLQCPFTQQIQRVHVGCPQSRRLVLTTESDGSLPSCGDGVVSQYYGSLFRPIVMIYDSTVAVREVLVDYVIWEAYGRSDYSFNLTTQQAGCIVPAQTISDFPAIHLADGSIDRDWGPATYHSCFEGEPSGVPDVPYEIINASSYSNAVVFSGGGLYTFRVRVVDPAFSYCDLTADITIDVYGAPLSGGYSAAIVIGTSLVVVASLIVSYMTYKKTQKIVES